MSLVLIHVLHRRTANGIELSTRQEGNLPHLWFVYGGRLVEELHREAVRTRCRVNCK